MSVSPRRWNGMNTSSRRSGGIPGPRSTTRSRRCRRNELAARRTRVVGGDVAHRVREQVHDARAAAARRRRAPGAGRRIEVELDLARAEAELVERREARRRRASVGASVTPSTPACTRLTSSRSVTSAARESRLSSAVSSSSARSLGAGSSTSRERSPLTAAEAAVSGRRRSWLTAESRAERTRSVSASAPAASAASRRAPCSMACVELRGDHLQQAALATPRGPGRAARAPPRAPIGHARDPSSPARLAVGGDHRASPSTSRRTPVRPNASRVRARRSPAAASSPRSTLPGDRREQLGLGGRAAAPPACGVRPGRRRSSPAARSAT